MTDFSEIRRFPGMPIPVIKMIAELDDREGDLLNQNRNTDTDNQEVQIMLETFFDFESRHPSELVEKCSQVVMETLKWFNPEDWVFYMNFVMMELKEKAERGEL